MKTAFERFTTLEFGNRIDQTALFHPDRLGGGPVGCQYNRSIDNDPRNRGIRGRVLCCGERGDIFGAIDLDRPDGLNRSMG